MTDNKDELWVDMASLSEMFYSIDPKTGAAVTYVIKHVNPFTNIVFGTYADIAAEMGVSRSTATKNMKALCDKGLICKIGNGIWFVNPEKYFCGESADYEQLIDEYKKESGQI